MRVRIAAARFPEEGEIPKAEHVKGCEQRGEKAYEPQYFAAGALQECCV